MDEFVSFYLDGHSSKENAVLVRLLPTKLAINQKDGNETIASWDLADTVIEKEFDKKSCRGMLSNKKYPDARLVIQDEETYLAVTRRLPRSHAFIIPFTADTLIAACLICVIFMTIGYFYIRHESEILAPLIPQKYQEKLADAIILDMNGKTKTKDACTQASVIAKLQLVTSKISVANQLKFKPRLVVVNDNEVNAYALPGSVIVINKGLLENAQSSDEFAGVMAHEMGHLKHLHPQQALVREIGINLFTLLTIGSTDIRSAPQLLIWAQGLSYSREKEDEADREGAEFLKQAHINPDGIAQFLKRLKDKSAEASLLDGEWGQYLSTHPSSESRAALFRSDNTQTYMPPISAQDWDVVKTACKNNDKNSDKNNIKK